MNLKSRISNWLLTLILLVPMSCAAQSVSSHAANINNVRHTDGFASIQAAIDDAPASGGVVFISPGSYTISGSLTLNGKTHYRLSGAGPATKLIAANATFDMLVIKGASSDVTIEGILFQGASVGSESRKAIDVPDASISRGVVRNCWMTGMNDGISIDQPSNNDWLIEGNYIYDLVGSSSGNGIGVFTAGNRNKISNNSFSNLGRHDVYLTGTPTTSASYNVVSGNTSTGNGAEAIAAFALSTHPPVTGNVIVGNTIVSPSGYGIGLDQNAVGNVVAWNYINTAVNVSPAIILNGSTAASTFPDRNIIKGNIIVDTGTSTQGAIQIQNGSWNTVSDNNINGGGSAVLGIFLNISGSPATTPIGNSIHGNTVQGTFSNAAINTDSGATDTSIIGNTATGTVTCSSSLRCIIAGTSNGSFKGFAAGPPNTAFDSLSQSYLPSGVNVFSALNDTSKPYALLGLNQSNTAAAGGLVGIYGVVESSAGSATAVEGDAYVSGSSSGNVTGVVGYAEWDSSGTSSFMAALHGLTNARTAGTVTNNYGLFVSDQAGVGTNNWAIRTVGSAKSQFGGAVISAMNTVTFSATPTFDASLGNTQKITLTGNVTSSTLSNATAGETINFIICQDSGGSHTFVWPTTVKGGMTIGSTLSTCSAQSFIFDGTNAYASSAGMTNM